MVAVQVISKKGCHLCEMVHDALRTFDGDPLVDVHVVDILDDQVLHDQYFLRIPVVFVDGKVVFEARDFSSDDPLGRLRQLVSYVRAASTA